MLVTQGPGGTNYAKITNSEFSNCAGDGLFMYNAPFVGVPGPSRAAGLDIDRTTITSEGGYGLRWANYGPVDRTTITVRNSFLAGGLDKAAIALIQNQSTGSTKEAVFDFGRPGSPGGNCIGMPGPRALEMIGFDATFVGNFWGANPAGHATSPLGSPARDVILATGNSIDVAEALSTAPSTCGRPITAGVPTAGAKDWSSWHRLANAPASGASSRRKIRPESVRACARAPPRVFDWRRRVFGRGS